MVYQRNEAVRYALRWALHRNPAYFDYESLGGDCTNFVSQVLRTGGAPMDFTETFGWYYQNANDKAPAWTAVEPLYRYLMRKKGGGVTALLTDLHHLELGDLIQFSFDGTHFQHTAVVTGSRGGVPLVCAHSVDARQRPMDSYEFHAVRFLHIVENV